MLEILLVLMGVCIGFGIRPFYVLFTGRDIPCVRDDDDKANSVIDVTSPEGITPNSPRRI